MTQTVLVDSPQSLIKMLRDRFQDDPAWMLDRRLEAAERLFSLDWPKLERTPLKKRRLEQIPLYDAPPAPTALEQTSHARVEIFLDNNLVTYCRVPQDLAARGLVLKPLRQALSEPEVEKWLGRVAGDAQDKIAASNDALWQNGVYLSVPAHLPDTVEVSIEHRGSGAVRALFTKNLIIAGEHSHLIITERTRTEAADHKVLLSEVTEVVVQPGARVQFGAVQVADPSVEGFFQRVGLVHQDGSLDWHIGEFGSGLVVSSHASHLAEPGASTHSITVFFGSHQQHQDYTAKSFHEAPHTTSNMVARGVMKDRARSVFTGLTQIQKGARGSDGRQKEQTLMLSDDSRADAIPSLVIDERDVFAAHAASAGPVDKNAVFYLTSRGLTEADAMRLIVHGFLAPVIDSIPHEGLREEVWSAVERKIVE